jgi:putative transposase
MKRIEGLNHARFLTFSCYRRMDLLGSEALRDEFVRSLGRAREKHAFLLHAYVVMPNHVHLLLHPERDGPGVTPILYSLKQSFAQRVIKRWRDIDAPILSRIKTPQGSLRFWQQGGGYDRNIYSDDEMREKVEYIHANPVRAELVAKPTDWRWSSARWWADRCEDAIPMDRIDF